MFLELGCSLPSATKIKKIEPTKHFIHERFCIKQNGTLNKDSIQKKITNDPVFKEMVRTRVPQYFQIRHSYLSIGLSTATTTNVLG